MFEDSEGTKSWFGGFFVWIAVWINIQEKLTMIWYFFCLTNFEIVCTGICIEWYWYKQVLIQCIGLHLSNCDFIWTDYQVFDYDLIFEWHKKMPPPSPQKSPILDFLVHCGNAIWIYYGTESTHFEKKNRSALKLGPSQRTLKKLFKVSTCTNSSLNFNWCLRKNLAMFKN